MAILEALQNSPYFLQKLAQLKTSPKIFFSGMIGSSKAAVVAALFGKFNNLLLISSSAAQCERIRAEIEALGGFKAKIYPALDVSPDEPVKPGADIVGRRLSIAFGWQENLPQLVIAPIKAVLQSTSGALEGIRVAGDQAIRMEELIEVLIKFGYSRLEIVGERGEFSVRGGIVDIFPVNENLPFRLELSADKIETLRQFDPYTQRSIQKIAAALILPAIEKSEADALEIIPPETLIVLDDILEVGRAAEGDFSKIQKKARVELSNFLREGEADDGAMLAGLGLAAVETRVEPVIRKAKPIREGVADELLADLKIGDYVVHENYGIGRYQGMKTLEIDEVKQEYLLIEYAEGDKLYVPPAMIGLVEKYAGGRETHPRLSRLGSKEWLATRGRVKQSVQAMTRELLEIYAAREKLEGYAFPPDDIWQKELEGTFPFEETPDQWKAIQEVKRDMESPRPMDRLVCGDVGYGKTEIALRAAAKAASAGKQVALIAPTTILVEQHYNSFKQRFKGLPFVIEMLSRFRGAKDQKQVVRALEAGAIDIVIGTHRLLSKDVKFKDLGLLIVDEEQKFGVAHKEKLKKIKKNVDVLTLTATPIPRTLYFSLSGVRELSLISTPPVDRSPIRTHILPFSEKVIREAVRRELDRGGQVYFLHNFVETIEGMASKIKKLIPEARVAVGHGQMNEKKLEKTMLDFLERRSDILVCTAIIESGLDITSVNTIIIDQADRLGLSQLYQIRGRVGRSAVRAYAYLFYHPARSMTDQAVERLKAIQEFTALGSGYKLAMRDLEIRGSGNLLGAQQSGHIYAVGFDLYCELLEEAVRELKGEKVIPPREVEIDLRLPASIPADYVTDDRQRIALYRRMNSIVEPAGLEEMKKELKDRYGKSPPPLETLFRIIEVKIEAIKRGVRSVKEKDGAIRIEWQSNRIKEIKAGKGDKIKLALSGIAG